VVTCVVCAVSGLDDSRREADQESLRPSGVYYVYKLVDL
jgi:hypothetical protein